MHKTFDYFRNNYIDIFIMVIIMFFIKMFLVLNNITLFSDNNNNKNNPGININIEPFTKYDKFCEKFKGNSKDLEEHCNNMSNNNCKQLDCCVLLKPSNGNELKCVSGDKYGPTYQSDEFNKNIDYDYYMHKNNKIEIK